ncbi:MAG: TIGR03013 family PEP-CTERM/XrtA system glycosyltransferase [Thermodesulfovibrionales bacterium]|nr:TIGR03013 family PEP-CTERM/XrtA system glycosyltransferase [Thermodesulfovibrionales bacterium]
MNRIIFIILGDVVLAVTSFFTGILLRFGTLSADEVIEKPLIKIFIFTVVVILISFLAELYNQSNDSGKMIFLKIVICNILSVFILSVIFYFIPSLTIGRGLLAITIFSFSIYQFLWHRGWRSLLNMPLLAKRVLILGTGPVASKIGNLILSTNHQYALAGYVHCSSDVIAVPREKVLCSEEKLGEIVLKEKANKVIVSISERRGSLPLRDLLMCKFSGIEVLDAPSFYEQLTGKLLIENITPSWFIFSNGFKITFLKRVSKRIMDIIMAFTILIITFPLMCLVALLIKLDSRGPVLYRQIRTGEKEKKFVMYKFRTMVPDAEKDTGPVWAEKNDLRITRIGKILRKTRLDELPQIFNVIKGEMSFVGPRPERPEFVEKLKQEIPFYSERHFVKPGITGWAQIRYPYGASVEDAIEKLRYDLFYIKHLSIFFDLMIIIETIRVIILGRGR